MNHAITRRERIRRRPDFLRVQQQGIRTRGRYLTLFVLPSAVDVTRLGVTATRRLGGAVRRNQSKRMIREIFRLNKIQNNATPLDIVVMPRPGIHDVPFHSLQADYLSTLTRYARFR